MMSHNEVTRAGGAISPTGTLAQTCDTLKDAGFTEQEIIRPAKTHNGGCYRPPWGGVWVKQEEVAASMSWLSRGAGGTAQCAGQGQKPPVVVLPDIEVVKPQLTGG